jgi:hypothetical protein
MIAGTGNAWGSKRWAWVGAAAAVVLIAAVLAALPAMRHKDQPARLAATSESLSGTVACTSADTSCERRIADLSSRSVLTAADRKTAKDTLSRVVRAVSQAASACAEPGGCSETAPAVVQALKSAGYRDVAARVAAGGSDIAADGSLIAAVGVGPACVIVVQDRAGDMTGSYAGRLPDGSCLAAR